MSLLLPCGMQLLPKRLSQGRKDDWLGFEDSLKGQNIVKRQSHPPA